MMSILRQTAGWLIAGVAIMLLGTGIVQAAVLPKVHSCPPNGSCSVFFDPNQSNILNLLQTLMDYWLKLGLILVGFGLVKLSAYQAWFRSMKHRHTINDLDLTLGAVKGGLLDTLRLALKSGTFFFSLLILAQIGLGSVTNLLVGLSIDRTQGERTILFLYPDVSELPDSSSRNLNTDGQVRAIAKVENWVITNDTTHDRAFKGTLVVPDGRTNSSVDPIPGGPQIDGTLTCSEIPAENVTAVSNQGAPGWSITLGSAVYLAVPTLQLAVTQTRGIDTAFVPYLWVSNTSGILPNATSIDNGSFFVTRCGHHVSMRNSTSTASTGSQVIKPNIIANVPGCTSSDQDICVADSVSNAILEWWGGIGQSFWKLTCRGGLLGPIKWTGDPCPLTVDVWRETVTAMLDGIMQTAPSRRTSTQTLLATVEIINPRRWWLIQGLIPLFAVVLYFLTLAYTVYISEGSTALKELNLAEIIDATQTDHVRESVKTGPLKQSTVRYGNNVGFLEDSAQGDS